MITRVKKVKNVGSFQFYDWSISNPITGSAWTADVINFKKNNILYGENGNGKSTIVSLFKSLHKEDSNIAKHWDRPAEDRLVEIGIHGQQDITYGETTGWSNNILKDKFIFFNKEFVEKYIHSGLAYRNSSHDKETGKLILYLGDFHLYKLQLDKIYDIRSALIEKNKNFESETGKIARQIDPEKNVSIIAGDVLEMSGEYKTSETEKNEKTKADLIAQRGILEKAIKDLKVIILKATDVIALKELKSQKELPNIEKKEIDKLFGFSVSSEAVAIVERIKGKEDFLREGTALVNSQSTDLCPYCEQSIIGENGKTIDIIEKYKELFNKEFIDSQNTTSDKLKSYKENLNILLTLKINEDITSEITKINKLFNQEYSLPSISLSENEALIVKKEIGNADSKLLRMLEPIASVETIEIGKIIIAINKRIETCTSKLTEINNFVKESKEGLSKGTTQQELTKKGGELAIISQRIYVIANLSDLKIVIFNTGAIAKNKIIIEKLNSLFEKYRILINENFGEFVSKYFSLFQKYIQALSSSLAIFQINKSNLKYDARNNEVVCGFEVRYKGQDRFKDLSEGEKQIIALAFFFALLETETLKKEKIIVFDDPITNFDGGKRRQAAELIKENTFPFKQVFIFTCDPLFRYYTLKVFKNDRNVFNILKSASSSIHFVPENRVTIFGSFKTDLINISASSGTDENVVVFGQKLRYCVEEIKDTYLGFGEDKFEQILNKVKNKDYNKLKSKIEDLRQIYSFCNTGGLAHYPRDGMTTWTELKFYTKKYLSLGL